MEKYWKTKHLDLINSAKSFSELGNVALSIAKKMPQPLGQVCGPISSGGEGSIKKNMEVFRKTIDKVVQQGKNIFDQLPLEEPIHKINTDNPYDVLNGIYLPLFESGLIKELYFMYNWQSSFGTNWEHNQAKRLNINRFYLPKDFLKN